jgi:alanine dehydrogenase
MLIGIPKEIKESEYRVGLIPDGAAALVKAGHSVRVQKGAGEAAGYSDAEYRKNGARIVSRAAEAWNADLVVKVKEPLAPEYACLRAGQMLFTFLHLAPNPVLVKNLLRKKVTAIGYETVEDNGRLPILEPMSEIAGRISALVGAYYQANPQGGRGVLFGGMPGVLPAHVVVLGGGTVGENAARVAAGMGSRVTVLERRMERMRYLDEIMPSNVSTENATSEAIEEAVISADIVIGAVHIPGSKTPKLITRPMVRRMRPRSVIVDIDQGGSCETSRPTSHSNPTFLAEGVLHYCVPNMPGAYGRTSTQALLNATFSYVKILAQKPLRSILEEAPGLAKGIQCFAGHLVCAPVGNAQKIPVVSLESLV